MVMSKNVVKNSRSSEKSPPKSKLKTLYSSKYNVEFYHIPKNAMTSTIKSLNLRWVPTDQVPENRVVFCILRSPINRCVSSYLQLRDFYNKGKFKFSYRRLSNNKLKKIFKTSNVVTGFRDYLFELETNGFLDAHDIPQLHYLTNEHKILFPNTNWIADRNVNSINKYLDIENLSDEMKDLLEDKNFEIKRVNKSTVSLSKRIKHSLDSSLRDRINKIYSKDFELYTEHIKRTHTRK
jgi:hypothetical protein